MASADIKFAGKQDWIFSNPWPWFATGVGLTLWSLAWTLTFGASASDNRVIVLAVGLLLTAIGVWLRWNDRDTLYVLPRSQPLANAARLGMAGLFALIGLAVTVGLGLSWFQPEHAAFKPGVALLVWLSVGPATLAAARALLKRESRQLLLDVNEEVGLSFVAAGVIAFVGSWTLYLGEANVNDWDTMRLFLRVLVAVCVLAGALVVVAPRMRRLVLSLLVVLHFAAIASAVLSAPPAPWAVQQIWLRLFRPYLEFTYMNNAHHYYAPEPNATSHLWFRVIFTTPEGKDVGMWHKAPDLDDNHRSKHPIGLEYQRQISLTEAVGPTEAPPPHLLADGKANPFFWRRLALVPLKDLNKPNIIGKEGPPEGFPRIPLARMLLPQQQISVPAESSRALYASCARHLAHRFAIHPENPAWKFKSVKIYRSTHMILSSQQLNMGFSPTDPELYRTFYVGNFLPDGSETNLDDPYRHWLLPVLRDAMNDPASGIKDYVRKHSGDPEWYRPHGLSKWGVLTLPDEGFPDDVNMKF